MLSSESQSLRRSKILQACSKTNNCSLKGVLLDSSYGMILPDKEIAGKERGHQMEVICAVVLLVSNLFQWAVLINIARIVSKVMRNVNDDKRKDDLNDEQ